MQKQFYILVRSNMDKTLHTVDLSEGYPYRAAGLKFLSEETARRIFDRLIEYVRNPKYSEMSDGSLSLPYELRVLGEINNKKRSDDLTVFLKYVSFSEAGDLTDHSMIELNFKMSEGNGMAGRQDTKVTSGSLVFTV